MLGFLFDGEGGLLFFTLYNDNWNFVFCIETYIGKIILKLKDGIFLNPQNFAYNIQNCFSKVIGIENGTG